MWPGNKFGEARVALQSLEGRLGVELVGLAKPLLNSRCESFEGFVFSTQRGISARHFEPHERQRESIRLGLLEAT